MATSVSSRRADVRRLLGNIHEEKPPQLEQKVLPYDWIIVLKQTRQTFDQEYIRSLAENIRVQGLINPLVVVRYNLDGFARYLQVLNNVWGTTYQPEEFTPVEGQWYYPLVAGECRYRATGLLERLHVDVRLGVDTDPITALYIQNAENTYTPPPEHEQAYAYQRLFTVIRQADPNFPLAAFARHVRRSPDTIRRALLFCALPDEIQFNVRQAHIRYGIAIQLARLLSHLSEAELMELMRGAMVNRTKVPDFRLMVTKRIQVITTGQGSLLGIFQAEQEAVARKAARRRTVAREYGIMLDAAMDYVRRLNDLMVTGQLGTDLAPYASGSVRDRLSRLIKALESNLPLLEQLKLIRRADAQQCRELLPQLEEALAALPAATQED